MIHVLIVDDNELARESIKELLRRTPDIELAGEASDGQEAIELASRLEPDVICMDISMPCMDGLSATTAILARRLRSRVLMVAMSYGEELVQRAVACGAKGFVSKTDMFAEIAEAVREVNAGKTYFSKRVAPVVAKPGRA